MKFGYYIVMALYLLGCAGPNPNPGERITDMAWNSGKFERAYEIAKPKADAGYPWAQLRLAIFYENGWSVEKDYKKAYDWYIKAVSQKADGNWANGRLIGATGMDGYFNQNSDALVAEFNLANLYYRGQGTNKDLIKAFVHVSTVIKESDGRSVFFCCEFSGGRYFQQAQFINFRDKVKMDMSKEELKKAMSML